MDSDTVDWIEHLWFFRELNERRIRPTSFPTGWSDVQHDLHSVSCVVGERDDDHSGEQHIHHSRPTRTALCASIAGRIERKCDSGSDWKRRASRIVLDDSDALRQQCASRPLIQLLVKRDLTPVQHVQRRSAGLWEDIPNCEHDSLWRECDLSLASLLRHSRDPFACERVSKLRTKLDRPCDTDRGNHARWDLRGWCDEKWDCSGSGVHCGL
ncbi:hypothetical protein BLNAU_6113 [Blattamonas nauphoetae]|uniref:Uncharacterized protein n=1 Tax=Blattamonas nauphoetae TaxID=2049346 RepID=A0ABQ9Y589_9EUKA|nr:hypothetical protein BLNAU_6113 [Blattamonas nauphoetae]